MMVGMEDLGLSLSLNSTDNHHHSHNRHASTLQLNLMPSSSSSSPSHLFSLHHQKSSWNEAFASSSDRNSKMYRGIGGGEMRSSFLRGIDVNRKPSSTTIDCELEEEEAGVSSPNSTISSLSGKRSERDEEINEMERACSRGLIINSDEEDGSDPNSRNNKKLRLSKDQSAILEDSFKENNTLNPKQKLALAKQLNLRPRQVEVWFQNRRARTKLKQTEVDCEFLKRCCENLTDENRRLQKEVQELRALKLSPQFYMQMTPPTTLTMCPSCERVASTTAVDHHHHNHHPMVVSPQNHHRPMPINRFGPPARSIADHSMMLHLDRK
ncbi:Homeobox domain [Macleaya cordata]|uniref:Homeobox domain n=1 Tax=Macleaya cordata TaxID=56857 RepID=A0A200QVE5_MACCD|nr:Homeobox domain [Macleaya cordata]